MSERRNPAQEAELERLIAEQAADDTEYIPSHPAHETLEKRPEGAHGVTLEGLITEKDRIEPGGYRKVAGKVTPRQVREWRMLRNKEHWTYQAIAEWAEVSINTVKHYVRPRSKQKRIGPAKAKLMERLDEFQAAYEAGALLREIAEVHYRELGYRSWQSCYQQLRKGLIARGVEMRPQSWKHGFRSRSASEEDYRRYCKEQNRKAVERSRAAKVRCDGVVNGRSCRRYAVPGSRLCAHHNPATKRQPKWTGEAIISALQAWAKAHERNPMARDWAKVADEHPTFTTVVQRFGKWRYGLYAAGLIEHKDPKPAKPKRLGRRAKLNRGYKVCAQTECSNVVPPKWTYCRDRKCQDARTREARAENELLLAA